MDVFPAYFALAGRRIVIAGEGEAAAARTRLFAGSPAAIDRVEGSAAREAGSYEGALLVFVASDDADFRSAAARAAKSAGACVNVADDPAISDFHTPAIIDRGAVVIGIGTGGAAPLLASMLRAQLDAHVPEGVGALASLLGHSRAAVAAAFPDLAERRAFLREAVAGPIGNAALAGAHDEAARLLAEELRRWRPSGGRISLIETGGATDLLSVRAVRALGAADAIAADPVGLRVSAAHGRRDAARLDIAEVSAASLAALAANGSRVAVVTTSVDERLGEGLRRLRADFDVLPAAPSGAL